jgi:N-carbamoylputrescine amidase
MRLTVCQLRDDRAGFEAAWDKLRAHVAAERPDVVLLPELPFAPWFAIESTFDAGRWRHVMLAHDAWDARLVELEAACVISTRPVERGGKRLNEAFAAFRDGLRVALHEKRYLPRYLK